MHIRIDNIELETVGGGTFTARAEYFPGLDF